MDVHDYPLLHVPDLMLAILRAAAARPDGGATVGDGVALLRRTLEAAKEDPPVGDAEIAERLGAVTDHLAAAGVLEAARGGRFRLTELGRRVLDENPDGVDDSVLERYVAPERLAARTGKGPVGTAAGGGPAAEAQAAPPRQREYDEGAAAFREGRDISANPHPLDTGQHQAWEAGWSEAHDQSTGGGGTAAPPADGAG